MHNSTKSVLLIILLLSMFITVAIICLIHDNSIIENTNFEAEMQYYSQIDNNLSYDAKQEIVHTICNHSYNETVMKSFILPKSKDELNKYCVLLITK